MAGIVELDPFLQAGSPFADTRVDPEASRLVAEGGAAGFWRTALELAASNNMSTSWLDDGETMEENPTKRTVHSRVKSAGRKDPQTGHEVSWEAEILLDSLPHSHAPHENMFSPVLSRTFEIIKIQLAVMAQGGSKTPAIPGALAIVEFTGNDLIPNHASLAFPKLHWKKRAGLQAVTDATHEFEIVTNVSDVSVNRLLSAVLRTIYDGLIDRI